MAKTSENSKQTDAAGPDADRIIAHVDPDAPALVEAEETPIVDERPPPTTPSDDTPPQRTPAANSAPEATPRAGFVPLLIGGLAAGGIVYAVETFLDGPDNTDALTQLVEDQAEEISALRAEIEALPQVPDLTPLQNRIDEVEGFAAGQAEAVLASVDTRLSDLEARLTDVEKRPGSDGTLSDSALEAYQRELDQLRSEVESMAGEAEAALAAARAEAEAMEQEALAAARAAAGRAALNRIAASVETGEPFADVLPDLAEVVDVPAALSAHAEDGVQSRADLQESFPDIARAALAAARDEGVAEEGGGLGSFLRSQFDVRSTTPREGTTPDAILSRAEAAVREGRLSDALAEIAALPEVARAEMTDWTAAAEARVDVLNAISALSETLNQS